MWLIKLPFRIIALPIMAVVGALSIFYRLILEVGLLAIGLIYVILGIGLVNYLIQRNWLQVGIILGIGGDCLCRLHVCPGTCHRPRGTERKTGRICLHLNSQIT